LYFSITTSYCCRAWSRLLQLLERPAGFQQRPRRPLRVSIDVLHRQQRRRLLELPFRIAGSNSFSR
jgi:hypothetical protein